MAEFSHNMKVHLATKKSLFWLTYGLEPQFTILPGVHPVVLAADKRVNNLLKAWEEAQALLEVGAERIKEAYNHHVQEAP